jgi:hypothetical protein
MDVCLLWVFVLSGRSLCDGPIPRPEESYRLWCVSECDQVKINNLDTYCESVEGVRTTKRRITCDTITSQVNPPRILTNHAIHTHRKVTFKLPSPLPHGPSSVCVQVSHPRRICIRAVQIPQNSSSYNTLQQFMPLKPQHFSAHFVYETCNGNPFPEQSTFQNHTKQVTKLFSVAWCLAISKYSAMITVLTAITGTSWSNKRSSIKITPRWLILGRTYSCNTKFHQNLVNIGRIIWCG